MHLALMIAHLILPRKTINSPSMTTRIITVDEGHVFAVVRHRDVAFEIGFAVTGVAAGVEEAEEFLSVGVVSWVGLG